MSDALWTTRRAGNAGNAVRHGVAAAPHRASRRAARQHTKTLVGLCTKGADQVVGVPTPLQRTGIVDKLWVACLVVAAAIAGCSPYEPELIQIRRQAASAGTAATVQDAGRPPASPAPDPGDVTTTGCGDGEVSLSEKCDVAIEAGRAGACPSECPPLVDCVARMLNGSNCQAECVVLAQLCRSGDGCCPSRCDSGSDGDCSERCGDGIVQEDEGETCEPEPDADADRRRASRPLSSARPTAATATRAPPTCSPAARPTATRRVRSPRSRRRPRATAAARPARTPTSTATAAPSAATTCASRARSATAASAATGPSTRSTASTSATSAGNDGARKPRDRRVWRDRVVELLRAVDLPEWSLRRVRVAVHQPRSGCGRVERHRRLCTRSGRADDRAGEPAQRTRGPRPTRAPVCPRCRMRPRWRSRRARPTCTPTTQDLRASTSSCATSRRTRPRWQAGQAGAAGAKGNSGSRWPSVSADGLRVAFESQATNLVAADSDGISDVFVRDLQAGSTTLSSVASGGAKGNNASNLAALSPDGGFVAFESAASNLGTSALARQIYIRSLSADPVGQVAAVPAVAAQVAGTLARWRPGRRASPPRTERST